MTKLAALLFFLCALTANAAETPAGLFGDYRSATRKVCMPGGSGHRATCSRVADTMKIEQTLCEAGKRDVKVKAEFTLPDAQICSFEGSGYWNAEGRRLVVADVSTGCELSLIADGRQVRSIVVQPEQCNSPCAGRSWLEGVVLRRR